MNGSLSAKISNDLRESQIDWKVGAAFIPIAFATYLFHEFGHWTFGELSGTDMTMSLNNSGPLDGRFMDDSDALWSAIGGPAFTILQGLVFLFLTWSTRSIYAYSILFFSAFSRFFSLVFGRLDLQDEARIAAMLDWNQYLVAAIVLVMLFLILWGGSRIVRLNWKAVGYFTVLAVIAILVVIAVNDIILRI